MTDTSQEIYVYIVPAERRNGDGPSCRVLIKGNTHPQQIPGTVESHIRYLMESMARRTGKAGACHALHEGAKTSRGKVWELPNGQILSPFFTSLCFRKAVDSHSSFEQSFHAPSRGSMTHGRILSPLPFTRFPLIPPL